MAKMNIESGLFMVEGPLKAFYPSLGLLFGFKIFQNANFLKRILHQMGFGVRSIRKTQRKPVKLIQKCCGAGSNTKCD